MVISKCDDDDDDDDDDDIYIYITNHYWPAYICMY